MEILEVVVGVVLLLFGVVAVILFIFLCELKIEHADTLCVFPSSVDLQSLFIEMT